MNTEDYAHPDVLVSTDWVAEHANDSSVRIVEADEDVGLYDTGHIQGAVKLDWQEDLQAQVIRDFINKDEFEKLMAAKGIANDTTVVFYGDKNNWWACYTLWLFKLFGHADCRVMNGGRAKWIAEEKPLVTDIPSLPTTNYHGSSEDTSIRAFRNDTEAQLESKKPLVDVRSPAEYAGEIIAMEGYPQEGAQRAGHIPGALSIPWSQAANPDETFKSITDLRKLYEEENGLKPSDEVISYCRIGERSGHTWFVLTYLLGYDNVKNYDGSWTEWGSLVRAPIEK